MQPQAGGSHTKARAGDVYTVFNNHLGRYTASRMRLAGSPGRSFFLWTGLVMPLLQRRSCRIYARSNEFTLLHHGQKTLDLRETNVRKLMLDMTGLEDLWLSNRTEQLLFQTEDPDVCTIHTPESGKYLTLDFTGQYRPHPELVNLR